MGYSITYLFEEHNAVRINGTENIERHPYSKDIVIKLPAAVPVQNDLQPTDGKIEHNGEFYQMVSKQVINDTIYIHCEFDQNARERFMELLSRVNEQFSGADSDARKQAPSSVLKSLMKEYMTTQKKHVFYMLNWSSSKVTYFVPSYTILEAYHNIPSPPPNMAC